MTFTPSPPHPLTLSPSQIVCLEDEDAYLYAEVIQMIPSRQMCWVRPLLLAKFNDLELDKIYDLRSSSDLVWPEHFFRVAIDTEVIPLLVELETDSTTIRERSLVRQQLHGFLHRIWKTGRKSN